MLDVNVRVVVNTSAMVRDVLDHLAAMILESESCKTGLPSLIMVLCSQSAGAKQM